VTLKKDIVNAVQVSTRVRPLRGSDTPTPRHFLSTSLWQDRDVIKGALEKMTSEHQAALASKRAFEVELSKAKEELRNSERSCTAPPPCFQTPPSSEQRPSFRADTRQSSRTR